MNVFQNSNVNLRVLIMNFRKSDTLGGRFLINKEIKINKFKKINA